MSYRFRIYPTKEQEIKIINTFGCVRYIYNHFIEEHKRLWEESRKTITYYDSCKMLTVLKNENEWLKKVDNTSLQASLQDLDHAYKQFFKKCKEGKKSGYPKHKSKKAYEQRYRSKNNNGTIRIENGKVKIPKIGFIKCKISKQVSGRIINATIIKRPSGKYYISICFTCVEHEKMQKTGRSVGIDLGIKTAITTSDGELYSNNKYIIKAEKKLKRLQRELSRKQIGSNRRNKARVKIAKLHEHIANQRMDTMQKITTGIIRKYDTICIEDLDVTAMVKHSQFAKHINDVAFGEFRREIIYKAEWYGKKVITVNRFFPSSQLCSNCGAQWVALKDLSNRTWICPRCFMKHDRDTNAAVNILNEGLRSIT